MNKAEQIVAEEARKYSEMIVNGKWDIPTVSASIVREDTSQHLDGLLLAAIALSQSDGGTIYIMQGKNLSIKTMVNRSLNIYKKFNLSEPKDLRFIPLYKKIGEPNIDFISVKVALQKKVLNIPDMHRRKAYKLGGSASFDRMHGYLTKSLLTLPLTLKGGEEAVLQLVNCIEKVNGKVIPFNGNIQHEVENLCLGVTKEEKKMGKFGHKIAIEFDKATHKSKRIALFFRIIMYFLISSAVIIILWFLAVLVLK
ncbi:hypothetical protein ACFLZV_01170 [Candidatus Margulisiibacteriota bacterium]